MSSYRLTRRAEDDVLGIFAEGRRQFGSVQAARYHSELAGVFALIGAFPGIARERQEIVPPVRMHPHKAHLVIYRIEPDGTVLIIRVRHGREDWECDAL